MNDFAIPQPPRCYLKKNSLNRRYRNDWCDIAIELNDGEADCAHCSIARDYRDGTLEVKLGALGTCPTMEVVSQ